MTYFQRTEDQTEQILNRSYLFYQRKQRRSHNWRRRSNNQWGQHAISNMNRVIEQVEVTLTSANLWIFG